MSTTFSLYIRKWFPIRPPHTLHIVSLQSHLCPAASLRSVPLHSCRKLPMLRFASQRSNNAAGVPRHCTSLRPRRRASLLQALRFAPLLFALRPPPSAKGTRSASLLSCSFPARPPKAACFARRIAPAAVGLPLRSAPLYFT